MRKPHNNLVKYLILFVLVIGVIFLLNSKSSIGYKMIYGVAIHPGHYDISGPNRTVSLNLLKNLGVSMAREDITWMRTEKSKGIYDFTDADRRIEILNSINITTLPILTYSNPLYSNMPAGTKWGVDRYTPPRGSQAWEDYKVAFANFIYASVKHLSDKYHMTYFEIWNEPYGFWDPQTESLEERAIKYVELMRLAYPAAKRANPNSKILIGGQYITTCPSCYNTYLYKYGIKDYYDIINIHPYMNPDYNGKVSYDEQGYYDNGMLVNNWLEDYKKLLAAYGEDKKPWWVTEMGVPSEGCNFARNYSLDGSNVFYVDHCYTSMNDTLQAVRLTNFFKLVKDKYPQIEAVFWYDYKEDYEYRGNTLPGCPSNVLNSTCPIYSEARFGIVDWYWQPKPAYYAYQKLIKENK